MSERQCVEVCLNINAGFLLLFVVIDTIMKHEIFPTRQTMVITEILMDYNDATGVTISATPHQTVWLVVNLKTSLAKQQHKVAVQGKNCPNSRRKSIANGCCHTTQVTIKLFLHPFKITGEFEGQLHSRLKLILSF